MAEHFTKNTIEATFRCARCGKDTPHYVAAGRRGGCKICIAKQEAKPKIAPPAKQESLF